MIGFCVGAVVGSRCYYAGIRLCSHPQSIFIGVVAAVISNFAVYYRSKSRLDDTLDVFPCHGIGGMVGMLMTGLFATKAVNSAGNDGLFYGNAGILFHPGQSTWLIVVPYSFIVSFGIFKFINVIVPLRVSSEDEEEGLDASQHAEKYIQGTLLVATREGLKETSTELH